MTVDFDQVSAATSSTNPHTFTHTPLGTPRGVLVFVQTVGNFAINSVDYGSAALSFVTLAEAGVFGRSSVWFLGSGVPSGPQTVAVGKQSASQARVVVVTLTGDLDLEVVDFDAVGTASATLQYGGRTCMALCGLKSSADIVPTSLANQSRLDSEDVGSQVSAVDRQTTAGSADFTIGYTTAETVGLVAVAVSEVPAPPTLGSYSSAKGWRSVPEVHFTIDEVPVDVEEDWLLRSSAYGGYISGDFRIPERQYRRHRSSIEAGAPVVAHTQGMEQVWEGDVALNPSPREDGKIEIATNGPWVEAEAAEEVLAYQVRGGGMFAEGDGDPHNYAQNDGFELTKGGGKLQWKAPKGEDFLANQVASFVIWIPGAHFTRYAFVMNKNRDMSNFDIRVRGALGPSGSLTTIDTYTLGAANPSGTEKINASLGGDYDLLAFQILCSTDIANLGERLRVWLTSLRVNDRAEDDDMSASDVISDIGEALGWNTDGVGSTSANVLPLNWQESWAEALLYMADLEDLFVRRVAGGLQSGPFGNDGEEEWEVLRTYSGRPDLKELDLYNRFVVRYTTISGKPAEVVVDADPDPLPDRTRVMDYDLADPQPNDTLAIAVAELLMLRFSVPRWAGWVDVSKVRHKSGPAVILPGGIANILDWDQGKDNALRIHGMELRRTHARLSIESPVSLVHLMEEARRGLGHPRRRGKNR